MNKLFWVVFLIGCCPDVPGVVLENDGSVQSVVDAGYCVDPCWADLSVPLEMSIPDMCTVPDLSNLNDDCDDHHKHDDSPGHVKHCGLNHGHRTN
jgi:hypothetical protein